MYEMTRHLMYYLAAEVHRQTAEPIKVYSFYAAYLLACDYWTDGVRQRTIKGEHIINLARLINDAPTMMYRTVPVFFNNGNMGLQHRNIPDAMDRLCENGHDLSTDEWIKQFLLIHPFTDGNGRTASLLHNMFSDSLLEPHALPEYDWETASLTPIGGDG